MKELYLMVDESDNSNTILGQDSSPLFPRLCNQLLSVLVVADKVSQSLLHLDRGGGDIETKTII